MFHDKRSFLMESANAALTDDEMLREYTRLFRDPDLDSKTKVTVGKEIVRLQTQTGTQGYSLLTDKDTEEVLSRIDKIAAVTK
jgi:hypothetical protein